MMGTYDLPIRYVDERFRVFKNIFLLKYTFAEFNEIFFFGKTQKLYVDLDEKSLFLLIWGKNNQTK